LIETEKKKFLSVLEIQELRTQCDALRTECNCLKETNARSKEELQNLQESFDNLSEEREFEQSEFANEKAVSCGLQAMNRNPHAKPVSSSKSHLT